MMSSYLTFDLRYDPNIQCVQGLITGYAHVKISGSILKETVVTLFSTIEGELQEDQIKVIQMYKFKLSKIQIKSIFSILNKC